MTLGSVIARNRANAALRTGPRTANGKGVSAMNSHRHGATGEPDQTLVARYLSVILDQPQISLGDLVDPDDAMRQALALAQAEARLVVVQNALTASEVQVNDTPAPRHRSAHVIWEDTTSGQREPLSVDDKQTRDEPRDIAVAQRCVLQHELKRAPHPADSARAHRLLVRYVSETRPARRCALTAWLATKADTIAWDSRAKKPIYRNEPRYSFRLMCGGIFTAR